MARRRRPRVRADALGDRDPRRGRGRDRARVRPVGRRVGPDRRRGVYVAASAALVASVALLLVFWNALLDVFGKGEDLTGRLDIWESVIGLATERPWFGWGWVGYWNPFVEPFRRSRRAEGRDLPAGAQRLARRVDAAGRRRAHRLRIDRDRRPLEVLVPRRRPADGRAGRPAALLRGLAHPLLALVAPDRAVPRREPHPDRVGLAAAPGDRLGHQAAAEGARGASAHAADPFPSTFRAPAGAFVRSALREFAVRRASPSR
ncbi:O-antigen ligase family protein [Agromyces flavus]|uniref:O-antigen ligase family protein n=1 Tax=Agromyces flavus TaxID=589382 RepID=UPI00361D777F